MSQSEAGQERQKTLVVVDGANFIYRAHHASISMGRAFNAPDGTPTGALMVFANLIEKLRKLYKPDAIAIAFESPNGTFRDALFEGYKEGRAKTPDDVRVQMRLAKELFPLLGIPGLCEPGFEADDLLCAYGASASAAGWRVILATSDKDINQVVSESVGVWDPNIHKDVVCHTPESVKAKFGVPPEMMAQYLALMGDSIDNIPGVEGVGTKTAAKFLLKYGSIEGILEKLADLTPKMRQSFENSREILPLALQLSTARLDAPQSMTPDEIAQCNASPNWSAALPILERLALKVLLAKARVGVAMEKKDEEPKQAASEAAESLEATATASAPNSAQEELDWAQAVKAELEEREPVEPASPSASGAPGAGEETSGQKRLGF